MRIALAQMNASDDPAANLAHARAMVERAASQGAEWVLTPEVTNCVSSSREHQREVLLSEHEDITLAGLADAARTAGVWVLIGSLALRLGEVDGRFANRSFLIGPDGEIRARYDKIHMFDVDLPNGEVYRESASFRPGQTAVVARTPWGGVGLSICYDIRFPGLYRALAQHGAEILTVPAAFTVPTGRAHWEVLLRARAIENGCFVLAPAQCGTHVSRSGERRQTWGHSLVVSPWGEVLADGGDTPGLTFADLDMAQVAEARSRVPSLRHDRAFAAPA